MAIWCAEVEDENGDHVDSFWLEAGSHDAAFRLAREESRERGWVGSVYMDARVSVTKCNLDEFVQSTRPDIVK